MFSLYVHSSTILPDTLSFRLQRVNQEGTRQELQDATADFMMLILRSTNRHWEVFPAMDRPLWALLTLALLVPWQLTFGLRNMHYVCWQWSMTVMSRPRVHSIPKALISSETTTVNAHTQFQNPSIDYEHTFPDAKRETAYVLSKQWKYNQLAQASYGEVSGLSLRSESNSPDRGF
jgi:hypothetical protein